MAKTKKVTIFEHAQISLADDTITEISRDETRVYKWSDVVKEWDGDSDIRIVIEKDSPIPVVDPSPEPAPEPEPTPEPSPSGNGDTEDVNPPINEEGAV